jgi:hypothetical protein
MVAPIFNSMMRIDRSLVSAAEDAGASPFQIQKEIIVPLSASGIAHHFYRHAGDGRVCYRAADGRRTGRFNGKFD